MNAREVDYVAILWSTTGPQGVFMLYNIMGIRMYPRDVDHHTRDARSNYITFLVLGGARGQRVVADSDNYSIFSSVGITR